MSYPPEVIAAARERYARLKNAGQTEGDFEARRDAAPEPREIDPTQVVTQDTIPGGWYWHGIVRKGEVLRIASPSGNKGIPLLLWHETDPSERLNPADTIKLQWTAAIGRGRVLMSDMGRAMASVIGGPERQMDCIAGYSSEHSNVRKYGDPTLPATATHFLRIASKYGLGKRDVGPGITLFAPLSVDGQGSLVWDDDADLKGQFDLRAEMDLIAAISNCPHPLCPDDAFDAAPIDITVWQAAPAAEQDLCRTVTAEAVRAFENNAAMRFGGGR